MPLAAGLGYDLTIIKSERKVNASSNVRLTRNVAAKADTVNGANTH